MTADWIEMQIAARREAKAQKDWGKANIIRQGLLDKGIHLWELGC